MEACTPRMLSGCREISYCRPDTIYRIYPFTHYLQSRLFTFVVCNYMCYNIIFKTICLVEHWLIVYLLYNCFLVLYLLTHKMYVPCEHWSHTVILYIRWLYCFAFYVKMFSKTVVEDSLMIYQGFLPKNINLPLLVTPVRLAVLVFLIVPLFSKIDTGV